MATLVLSSVGAAIGSQVGGSVLGVSAAALGRAAGAVAGSLIDQRLLGPGASVVEGPRIARFRLPSGGEGASLPRVWGRMRVPGQVIWAARFKESVASRSQGGGGGKGLAGGGSTTVREYSYSASFAVALAEGPIDRIGRIWADGQEISPSDAPHRLYRGTEDQEADALIVAIEGVENAPAYRGVAYMVFEDLPLERFGNRVPQLSVEVFRAPASGGEGAPALAELARAVALIPGSGEFTLATEPVRRVLGPGASEADNVHSFDGRPDLLASLDQLAADLPSVESVSLVVAWFGDDLRCGRCRIRPLAERADRETQPVSWKAGGIDRGGAGLVSADAEGRPNFGGAPSDLSVMQAIQELKARGYRVTIYPFLLMDIPSGNGLPDPWGWGSEQSAFPWRGRITLDAAPGRPGSADGTAAAAVEVGDFFGSATPAQISWTGDSASYSGSDEGYRRFVLSLARIAAAAGGVDAFVLGSELRGLTQIRSGAGVYPAVAELRSLAADVRSILGGQTQLTYAADWSEYFGHQPPDGSGDVYFHLDALWADAEIDAVGVDAYFPLSDWAEDGDPADPAAASIYDLDYLRSRIEAGEAYDYYYASDAGRHARERLPISDGAYGEAWVFRPKDLRGWWSNAHYDRPGGVRSATPTAWVPESKPIWFTEIGCPAVDRGANQPNKFADLKSSESALPFASRGMRDDFIQRRFLQAVLGYWSETAPSGANPLSSLDGRAMVDVSNAAIWTWDARPWPDFPLRQTVWADGPNQPTGHWLQGRLGSAPLGDLVAEICAHAGLASEDVDVSALDGVVDGYLADRVLSPRELLQPLMLAYAFDAVESGGRIKFVPRGRVASELIALEALAVEEGDDDPEPPLERIREDADDPPQAVRFGYVEGGGDYRAGAIEVRRALPGADRIVSSAAPIALGAGAAQRIAERHLAEAWVTRDAAHFRVPPSLLRFEPGDVVALGLPGGPKSYRLARIADAGAREIEAVRSDPAIYAPTLAPEPLRAPPEAPFPAPPEAILMDLPLLTGEEPPHAPAVAATQSPWPGPLALWRSVTDDGYKLDVVLPNPSGIGALLDPLPGLRPWVWGAAAPVRVALAGVELLSREDEAVLAGANALAVEVAPEVWEIVQFREAELVAPDVYALSGLLRGQAGTEASAGDMSPAGARVVVLDAAVKRTSLPVEAIGLERHYRVGAAGRTPDPQAFAHLTHAASGAALRPYSPAHLSAWIRPNGNLNAEWIRRTRVGGDLWEVYETPLGEASERYRLAIEKDGSQVYEAVESAPSAVVLEEDLPAPPFTVAVSQISDLVGPGPAARVDIN